MTGNREPEAGSRLIRAWLATGISDAVFSSVLSAFFYGSTVARLWQGVATTAFGARVPANGTTQVVVGLLVHFTVALVWSTVFLLAYENLPSLRRATSTQNGMLRTAAIYGALIWVVMSMVVIRLATGRAPAITIRWWIQFFGHAIFVGLPIVAQIKANGRTGEQANGRTGEQANGRTGEQANGRTGEQANGRTGEQANGSR